MDELAEAEVALGADEPSIASAWLDRALKACRSDPERRLAVLRRRAEVACDEAADDDLADLSSAARRTGQVLDEPGATDEDAERHAFLLLLSGSTGRGRKATRGDPLIAAALAYAARPTDRSLRALTDVAGSDPVRLERAARLVVQRQRHPGAPLATSWLRALDRPPWDRTVARAVRVLGEGLRIAGQRAEAEESDRRWEQEVLGALPAGDERARIATNRALGRLAPADALPGRLERLRRSEERYGASSPLLEPALWALSSDARHAGHHEVAVGALRRLERVLAGRGRAALQDRRVVLGDLRRSLQQLGHFDEAQAAIEALEQVLPKLGQPVPAWLARADLARAMGDLEGCVRNHRRELERCEAGVPPTFGPDGSTTQVVRAWTAQAVALRDRARGSDQPGGDDLDGAVAAGGDPRPGEE
ncbi:MAG: hypothetical protein KC621_07190 [Myxococcales bacterium]|nr:hypothetical protein [Myxococcales bacterium]